MATAKGNPRSSAGLLRDKATRSDRQVPLLGNIPLVGKAFRGTSRAEHKSELVIFLTPTNFEDPGF